MLLIEAFMVQVELSKIILFDMQELQTIFLKEVNGERRFPMVIGADVATAIHRRVNGMQAPRPQTHDLLNSVIDQLGGTVERIDITALKSSTYYARIVIRQGKKQIEIDCRPSDAIAVGALSQVPIFVAEDVLEEASGSK